MWSSLIPVVLMCASQAAPQVAPVRPRPPMESATPIAPGRVQGTRPLSVSPPHALAPDTARRGALQRRLGDQEAQLRLLSAELAVLRGRASEDNASAADIREAERTRAEIDAVVESIKNRLDSLSEMGEMESLRLQMAMDRMSAMMSTLSNLLKKISDTSQGITQNLK